MQLPPLYRLWSKGEPVEGVSREMYLVGIEAYAKCYDDTSPYEFASEYVCGELASAIRLPVAHGIFVEREGQACYASFNSYMSEGTPPPCVEPFAKELVRKDPRVACGIVVFDLWLCNKDRHPKNVGYDRGKQTIHIFDHGEGLIRGCNAIQYWQANREVVELQQHCLARFIDDEAISFSDEWIRRIQRIPIGFIEGLLDEACCRFGITEEEAREGASFLDYRRQGIKTMIAKNPHSFPSTTAMLREAGG